RLRQSCGDRANAVKRPRRWVEARSQVRFDLRRSVDDGDGILQTRREPHDIGDVFRSCLSHKTYAPAPQTTAPPPPGGARPSLLKLLCKNTDRTGQQRTSFFSSLHEGLAKCMLVAAGVTQSDDRAKCTAVCLRITLSGTLLVTPQSAPGAALSAEDSM